MSRRPTELPSCSRTQKVEQPSSRATRQHMRPSSHEPKEPNKLTSVQEFRTDVSAELPSCRSTQTDRQPRTPDHGLVPQPNEPNEPQEPSGSHRGLRLRDKAGRLLEDAEEGFRAVRAIALAAVDRRQDVLVHEDGNSARRRRSRDA